MVPVKIWGSGVKIDLATEEELGSVKICECINRSCDSDGV